MAVDQLALNFDDSQVILAQDEMDVQYMLRKLYEAYNNSGLIINPV